MTSCRVSHHGVVGRPVAVKCISTRTGQGQRRWTRGGGNWQEFRSNRACMQKGNRIKRSSFRCDSGRAIGWTLETHQFLGLKYQLIGAISLEEGGLAVSQYVTDEKKTFGALNTNQCWCLNFQNPSKFVPWNFIKGWAEFWQKVSRNLNTWAAVGQNPSL